MKFATVSHKDAPILVLQLDDETVLDLAKADPGNPDYRSMLDLIQAGQSALADVKALADSAPPEAKLSLAEVSFRSPLRPEQYRDCLVFEDHLKNCFAAINKATGRNLEISQAWYDQPIYYKGNRFSFIGHGQDVAWPAYSEHLDIELELAIVIGREGRDVSAEDAPGFIWGYTILNDISARDAQMKESPGQLGPAKGKDFDTGNVLGPWVVTADEFQHPIDVAMEARVNGERWGGGRSGAMYHDFAKIISHISRSETLYPGEVIGSGTVGTGCGLETGRRLSDGDEIELEIEGIGVLRNQVMKAG